MKVIIAGSRSIKDMALVEAAIAASGYHITEVVSGGARGVDSLGEEWAILNKIKLGPDFSVPDYEWKKNPHTAGHKRNGRMAKYAEALIAIWDGVSGGTANMIEQARAHGLLVFVYRV